MKLETGLLKAKEAAHEKTNGYYGGGGSAGPDGFRRFSKNRMFTGEITDSRCGAAGGHGSRAETSQQCTLECVRAGARYVLYDPEKRVAYGLDNQRLPEGFAGDQVKVIGVYEPSTRSIHVFAIEPITENAQLIAAH